MNAFTSDFIDGLWGKYDFVDQAHNVLYGDLPKFSFVLGQLVFIALAYLFLTYAVRRTKSEFGLKNHTGWNLVKSIWQKGSGGKFTLLCFLAFGLGFSYQILGNAYSTVRIYSQYRTEVASSLEGVVLQFSISKGTARSSRANIDATFLADDQVYDLHIINANKRLANQILNQDEEAFLATLYLDKQGNLLFIDEFAGN